MDIVEILGLHHKDHERLAHLLDRIEDRLAKHLPQTKQETQSGEADANGDLVLTFNGPADGARWEIKLVTATRADAGADPAVATIFRRSPNGEGFMDRTVFALPQSSPWTSEQFPVEPKTKIFVVFSGCVVGDTYESVVSYVETMVKDVLVD